MFSFHEQRYHFPIITMWCLLDHISRLMVSELVPTVHTNVWKDKFEDTERVIRRYKSKDIQYNDQKKNNKQWSTKHYTQT